MIKAIGATENRSAVISAEDAAKIEALEKQHHFLEQGKVVIVL
jgi:hypothetical protein